MYKLLTSTNDEYESGFVRNLGNRDSQLKGDHIAAEPYCCTSYVYDD